MAFKVERIDHAEAWVRDLDQAAEWYRRILGLEAVHRWEPYPLMVGAGGTMIALFPMPEGAQPQEPRPGSFKRVAFRTSAEGFVAAQEHLRQQGVEFEGPVDHRRSFSIYFEDPDENPLEITHYV